MIEFSNELLLRWRDQVWSRRTRATNLITRRPAAVGYMTYGPPAEGLIEVDHLNFVVLYDEPVAERWPAIRLAGFTASRQPGGIFWGGPANNRFFKDLSLIPRWGAQGDRLDLAKPRLVELGLDLDQVATSQKATQATFFHLPRLWAGFRPSDAQLVERDCPELDRAVLQAGKLSQRVLGRLQWRYFGLVLFPYQWVQHFQDRAVAVFADLRQFPKQQAFQMQRLPGGLRGSYGSVPYDFFVHRFTRSQAAVANALANGRSRSDRH